MKIKLYKEKWDVVVMMKEMIMNQDKEIDEVNLI